MKHKLRERANLSLRQEKQHLRDVLTPAKNQQLLQMWTNLTCTSGHVWTLKQKIMQ
jgi:hypothetical protein